MLLAARNILKAWLLVLALAGVFALVGWLLDGVRGLSIFVFCALLLAAGAYWTFDRVALGMIGARELPVGEAPLLHSTVERLAARAGIVKPRLYLIPDGLPIAAATGRGVRSSALAVSTGCVAACAPAELEGVLAHEIAHVRLHDVQVQTAAVRRGRGVARDEPDRRLVRARAALRPRADRVRVRPPARVAEARVRGGPLRGEALRLAARPRRRAAAAGAGGGARRVRGQPGHRADVHDQPLRGEWARPRCSSRTRRSRSACVGCASSTRPGATASRAKRPPESGTRKSRSRGSFRQINRRRPTLPGGCPPSTIGPGRLNFSVRNGKRCLPTGMTAELSKACATRSTLKTP